MRRREHIAGLFLGLVLVVLGGRALAYAATPTPLAGELGGPRLPVIAFVALAVATVLSLGVLWLAALGVRERHALARRARRRASRSRTSASTPRARRRLAARLRRDRDLAALAHRHAHGLVAVPRGPCPPQCHPDPARALARRRGAARRPAPRAGVGAPRRQRAAAPAAAARRHDAQPLALGTRPSGRGCSHAPCVRADRLRSPSCSHCHEREHDHETHFDATSVSRMRASSLPPCARTERVRPRRAVPELGPAGDGSC